MYKTSTVCTRPVLNSSCQALQNRRMGCFVWEKMPPGDISLYRCQDSAPLALPRTQPSFCNCCRTLSYSRRWMNECYSNTSKVKTSKAYWRYGDRPYPQLPQLYIFGTINIMSLRRCTAEISCLHPIGCSYVTLASRCQPVAPVIFSGGIRSKIGKVSFEQGRSFYLFIWAATKRTLSGALYLHISMLGLDPTVWDWIQPCIIEHRLWIHPELEALLQFHCTPA
jgi:hypothetical protein